MLGMKKGVIRRLAYRATVLATLGALSISSIAAAASFPEMPGSATTTSSRYVR